MGMRNDSETFGLAAGSESLPRPVPNRPLLLLISSIS